MSLLDRDNALQTNRTTWPCLGFRDTSGVIRSSSPGRGLANSRCLVNHQCQRCGKQFLDARPSAKFCCGPCYWATLVGKRLLVERHCEQCGAPMMMAPHLTKRRRFCSPACYWASMAGHSHIRTAGIMKTCPVCNTSFRVMSCRGSQNTVRACAGPKPVAGRTRGSGRAGKAASTTGSRTATHLLLGANRSLSETITPAKRAAFDVGTEHIATFIRTT
jgi:hypothetical protein